MNSPIADDRLFPLVLYSLPERLDSDFVEQFTAKAEAILERREPHVTVVDLRAIRSVPSALVRRQLAAWSTARESTIRRYSIASGVVTDSPVIRGALTALFWIAPPPYAMEPRANRNDALAFVRKHYEQKCGPSPVFDAFLNR